MYTVQALQSRPVRRWVLAHGGSRGARYARHTTPYSSGSGLSDLGSSFLDRLPGIATGLLTGYITGGAGGALVGGAVPAFISTSPGTSALIGAGSGLVGGFLTGAVLNRQGFLNTGLGGQAAAGFEGARHLNTLYGQNIVSPEAAALNAIIGSNFINPAENQYSNALPFAYGNPMPATFVGSGSSLAQPLATVPVSYNPNMGGASPALLAAAAEAGALSGTGIGGPAPSGGINTVELIPGTGITLTSILPYLVIGAVLYIALRK